MADRKKPEWLGADGEPLAEWTITLRTPIKDSDDTPITELVLREPTAGELEKIFQKTGPTADIEALFLVTKLPHVVIKRLGVRDYRDASRYLMSFMSDALGTGEAS